jgi:sugar/nucleoside kinase (ribokinase family)
LKSPGEIDLLGMGIAPVDIFMSMDGYPSHGVKVNTVPGSRHLAGGGPVPNSLCTFTKLGGSASVISSFGDDHWGRFACEELDKFGVKHDLCVIRKKCPSALASAWININNGERTIALDMHPQLYIKSRDIMLSKLPRPKLIQVDGRHVEANLKLARWGKKIGARVMLDVGSVRNRVDDLFPHIDLLVCADEYACHYFKTRSIIKAARSFRTLGISEVVVTSGTDGSFGIDTDGNQARQKAYKVKAVDVTGAGDVYHGAYLFGIFKGWELARKMKFASAAAALKCRKPGARLGIPSLRQTIRFMDNHRSYYA